MSATISKEFGFTDYVFAIEAGHKVKSFVMMIIQMAFSKSL